MAVNLSHTIQTWLGMVVNNGAPHERQLPSRITNLTTTLNAALSRTDNSSLGSAFEVKSPNDLSRPDSCDGYISKAVGYLQNPRAFGTCNPEDYRLRNQKKFAANLTALTSDVDKEDLKMYIRTRTRFDLEQAAAIVVSAFMSHGRIHEAVRLVKELDTMLLTTCMWIELHALLPSESVSHKLENLGKKLRQTRENQVPLAQTIHDLVPLLIHVRRSKPDNRCLHIPQWMFDETGIDPPAHYKTFFSTKSLDPIAPRTEQSIILPRSHFRHIQRRIRALYQYWKPVIALRRRIKSLEDRVLYAASWIEQRVFQTDDVALLCHYFFYFQRRLQRKIVSDVSGRGFLGKGEGIKLFQNNVSITSTFENVLLDIAESTDEGIIVAVGNEPTLALVDETCILMKEYVDVHGFGKTTNLTFQQGQVGGKGRGPVDEYNLLCDILSQLRQQARDEGVIDLPGPTHKFLAKDIMQWNNTWKDDAFANGKKPGWQDWIEKRGLLNKDDAEWMTVAGVDNEKVFTHR
jgi:hypothetical protein